MSLIPNRIIGGLGWIVPIERNMVQVHFLKIVKFFHIFDFLFPPFFIIPPIIPFFFFLFIIFGPMLNQTRVQKVNNIVDRPRMSDGYSEGARIEGMTLIVKVADIIRQCFLVTLVWRYGCGIFLTSMRSWIS